MTETTELAKLLKPREAAAVLAIGERTLWRLTAGGDMPHVRIGRAVRYSPADLAAFVDRQRIKAKLAC